MGERSHVTYTSNTFDGQQYFWCVRYRTPAAGVELYYVDGEMYSYSTTATAATVTAHFYGAALRRVLPS